MSLNYPVDEDVKSLVDAAFHDGHDFGSTLRIVKTEFFMTDHDVIQDTVDAAKELADEGSKRARRTLNEWAERNADTAKRFGYEVTK